MEHDLNLTLKMYKSAFSVEQIIEIKKKMHIDPIFTYSDSEIALKVCRNKQRFKLNRSPLWDEKDQANLHGLGKSIIFFVTIFIIKFHDNLNFYH